jgi:hypothetical protein
MVKMPLKKEWEEEEEAHFIIHSIFLNHSLVEVLVEEVLVVRLSLLYSCCFVFTCKSSFIHAILIIALFLFSLRWWSFTGKKTEARRRRGAFFKGFLGGCV